MPPARFVCKLQVELQQLGLVQSSCAATIISLANLEFGSVGYCSMTAFGE